MFKKFVLPAAVMAVAIAGLAGAAIAQGFMPWEETLTKAMAGKKGMTMEMMHDYASHEKDAAGFEPFFVSHFKEIDTDNDGDVTMEEMHAWMDLKKMSGKQLEEAWYKRAQK